MNILLMGIPGSGKSIQAKKLADVLGLCYLATGEVLRDLSKQDNELGGKIKNFMDRGAFFDDDFVADLMKKKLSEDSCKNGFVSDSYPRHVPQLSHFDPNIERIFYLRVTPEEAKRRLQARHRMDDTDELIDRRYKLYKEKADEILKYYSQKIEVTYIDGEKSVEEVHQQILDYINGQAKNR